MSTTNWRGIGAELAQGIGAELAQKGVFSAAEAPAATCAIPPLRGGYCDRAAAAPPGARAGTERGIGAVLRADERKAVRLSSLTPDAWTPIATRVRAGDVDAWDWHLTPYDQSVLRMAQTAGHLTTAQRRRADGRLELVARAVRAERGVA